MPKQQGSLGTKDPIEDNPLTRFCKLTAQVRRDRVFLAPGLAEEVFPVGIENFNPAEPVRERSRRLRTEAGLKIRQVAQKGTTTSESTHTDSGSDSESETESPPEEMTRKLRLDSDL